MPGMDPSMFQQMGGGGNPSLNPNPNPDPDPNPNPNPNQVKTVEGRVVLKDLDELRKRYGAPRLGLGLGLGLEPYPYP